MHKDELSMQKQWESSQAPEEGHGYGRTKARRKWIGSKQLVMSMTKCLRRLESAPNIYFRVKTLQASNQPY
jgi:hypothetical protein